MSQTNHKFYQEYSKLLVSVDCVIFGFSGKHLKLLVHRRPYEPSQGELSLIGGFVNINESIDDAAKRVLADYTGIDKVYMRQLGAFGEVNRDIGERVVSIAFYALIDVRKYDKSKAKHNAEWIDLDNLPALCLDHNQMVEMAIQKIRARIYIEPIGINLLPTHFTLTQLQMVYEAVLGTPLDKRNFRRTIIDKDFLIKTGKIDKITSRRGAALYELKQTRQS